MLALWMQWMLFRLLRAGQIEGEAADPAARGLRHHLDALHHARHDLVLAGGVEVLGDLADEQDVHVPEAGGQPGEVPQRPHRREEAERAAQLHVEVGLVAAGRVQELGLERAPRRPHRVQHGGRQGRQPLDQGRLARLEHPPLGVHAGGRQDARHRRRLVEADAAPLNEDDLAAHGAAPPRVRLAMISSVRLRVVPCPPRSRVSPRPRASVSDHRRLDAPRRLALADVVEQQRGGADDGDGIREALARDVGRAAVHRLEHRVARADVGAGHQAEAAHQPRAQVADDVAEEVLHHQHVEAGGVERQLHAEVVDAPLLELDEGVGLRHRRGRRPGRARRRGAARRPCGRRSRAAAPRAAPARRRSARCARRRRGSRCAGSRSRPAPPRARGRSRGPRCSRAPPRGRHARRAP